jgi:hypothetical protein
VTRRREGEAAPPDARPALEAWRGDGRAFEGRLLELSPPVSVVNAVSAAKRGEEES